MNAPKQNRPHITSRGRSRRGGFTLIELLVVISIILVLIGLLIGGSKALINSSRRNLTLTRLAAMNNMLSELQSESPTEYSQNWFIVSSPVTAGAAYELDASQIGSVSVDAEGAQYMMTASNSTPPKSYSSGTVNSSRKAMLQYMTNVPGTALPSPPLPILNSFTGIAPSPAFNGAGVMYLIAASPTNAKALAALGPNATIPGPGGVAVVVDGWNNPILFCPGSGAVSGQNLGNGPSNPVGGMTNVGTSVAPKPGVSNAFLANITTITSPDGRPFFASAGADGDFAKGDDNLYSFEQK